ncbi:diacylglycerol/lipid kinase family protein [Flavitalea flava]
MKDTANVNLLFIINPGSGNNTTDWPAVIRDHFRSPGYTLELFTLPDSCTIQLLKQKIEEFNPGRVIVAGGDGSVKLVAEALLQTAIPMGILPAGSANGLAKELGIPEDPSQALSIIESGFTKKIHLTKINEEWCIHLSDIGFNANVVKKFQSTPGRGMWGYWKASWEVLWDRPLMMVDLQLDNQSIKRQAVMVVVANATKYGSGALINPDSKLDDALFEVIVVRKISLNEIFKMTVSHRPYDPAKTESFQVRSLSLNSRKKVHFQVDGEYLGKVNTIQATLLPAALEIIVPRNSK